MCGISGIVNKNNQKVELITITNINDLISHRGPDSEGFYLGENFAFGHRRLSILDLSDDGHQPMSYIDKYTITYNGEIYNYLELKKELKEYGYSFKSDTDTEVILASYDKWQENCVSKFNGMWAFSIYDSEKEILFCSRDRFGIKPFYYTEVRHKFIFGSEIKQLLEFYDTRKVNKKIAIDFIVTGMLEHTNETFFENILKLDPSHNLIYDLNDHTYEIKKYYTINLNDNISKLSFEESIKKYKKELERAIDYRLRSDVKVGTCLSGGIDSSVISTIASQRYVKKIEKKFTAIHAKSLEKLTDESKYAKIVAKNANLDLNIIQPSVEEFLKNIDEVVYTQEEPFGSPSVFMQYFVMAKAKELGCKVMLDGQGGDETLLGYEKYYPSVYVELFKKHGFITMMNEILNSNRNNSKMSLIWILKYTLGSLFSNLRKKVYKHEANFMKKEYKNSFKFFDDLSKCYLNVDKLQIHEIKYTNLPVLLRYEDKNSMKHSVETRLPFIDFQTLETALSIHTKYKITNGWTKYILRKIIDKLLPNEIVWRKDKLGFNAPDNLWLDSLSNLMEKEIKESIILNNLTDINKLLKGFQSLNNRLKWRLYNIAVWERIYNVKI